MTNPLQDRPPSEVLLNNAPLQRVIGLVSFSPIMKIVEPSGSGIADFQERIRRRYPAVSQEVETGIQLHFEGGKPATPQMVTNPVWRFSDKAGDWTAVLTRESIAIETAKAYSSRSDFLERLHFLTTALQEAFEPAQSLRLGVRYLNIIREEHLSRLDRFVGRDFLAFGNNEFRDSLKVCNNTAEFEVPEGTLVIKWGILKPGLTHDPGIMSPVDKPLWFLDLDAIHLGASDFDAGELQTKSKALAERIYSMFRWAVTAEFLESCDAR